MDFFNKIIELFSTAKYMESLFKEKEYANYRNTEISFVFQDYHLIEELTVKENILLSLNLRGIEDESKVSESLEKVDLNNLPEEIKKDYKYTKEELIKLNYINQ